MITKLLTRKSAPTDTPSAGLVHGLARGVARAIPTMDRRAFLRRSGLGVGAGIAAAYFAEARKAGKTVPPPTPTPPCVDPGPFVVAALAGKK